MSNNTVLKVVFWKSHVGQEPVREWLLSLSQCDKKTIGKKIMTVQFRWPLGMPTVRKIERDLWEVRIRLEGGNIARVMFTIFKTNMVLLHDFIKKSQKIPANDLALAKKRKSGAVI